MNKDFSHSRQVDYRRNWRNAAANTIEWCQEEIRLAEKGNDTTPYTKQGWIDCMNKLIAANKIIESQ